MLHRRKRRRPMPMSAFQQLIWRADACGCAACGMWARDADRLRADDRARTKHGKRFPHSHKPEVVS